MRPGMMGINFLNEKETIVNKMLPDEKPSQPAPPEAKAIAWGFIAWIVVAVTVVMSLYVFLKH